jgi:hypothetical protein
LTLPRISDPQAQDGLENEALEERDPIRAAVDAAHEAGRKGLNGQVLLQDQFSIEWTYGKDPYPPNTSDYLGSYR